MMIFKYMNQKRIFNKVVTLQWSLQSGHTKKFKPKWSPQSGHTKVVTPKQSPLSGHPKVVTPFQQNFQFPLADLSKNFKFLLSENFQRYFMRADMREISTEEFRKLSADKKATTLPINTLAHTQPRSYRGTVFDEEKRKCIIFNLKRNNFPNQYFS